MAVDPNEPVPGPYYDGEVGIYADHPQPVDHSRFRGFASPEPHAPGGGFLIAESIPHGPTRKMLAAAPDMLAALMFIHEQVCEPANGHYTLNAYKLGAGIAMARAAIAKARGEG